MTGHRAHDRGIYARGQPRPAMPPALACCALLLLAALLALHLLSELGARRARDLALLAAGSACQAPQESPCGSRSRQERACAEEDKGRDGRADSAWTREGRKGAYGVGRDEG